MNALAKNPFFRGLTSEQLDLIVPLFAHYSAPAGTTVFKQGDEAAFLYLIQSGTVTIQYKPYDGPIITLSHLKPGDFFGWSSVVGGRTYTSDVVCTTRLEALRLRGSDLVRLCKEHPQAGSAILNKLAEVVSPRWTYARRQIQAILENNAQPENNHARGQA
jgi:CRP/FNR family transcriptional regulator, cyclic AMP receptor protein